MSKVYQVGIIVFDDVLTSEVVGPAEVFAIAGQKEGFEAKVLLIGVEDQPMIRTEEGLRLGVDATIADDLTLDVLIVPGASDVDPLLGHAGLNAFIQKQNEGQAWLGSVCAGAFLLADAGVLDGKQATTWHGGEASLQAQFPALQVIHNQPVVVDDRRVTANGGLVSYRAALVLLGQVGGTALAESVYKNLGIARMGDWSAMAGEIAQ